MKYCSNCGNQLEDDAKFCSVCGMQQGQTPTPEEKTEIEQLKKEKKFKPVVGIAVGVVVVIAIICVIFGVATKNKKQSPKKIMEAFTQYYDDYCKDHCDDMAQYGVSYEVAHYLDCIGRVVYFDDEPMMMIADLVGVSGDEDRCDYIYNVNFYSYDGRNVIEKYAIENVYAWDDGFLIYVENNTLILVTEAFNYESNSGNSLAVYELSDGIVSSYVRVMHEENDAKQYDYYNLDGSRSEAIEVDNLVKKVCDDSLIRETEMYYAFGDWGQMNSHPSYGALVGDKFEDYLSEISKLDNITNQSELDKIYAECMGYETDKSFNEEEFNNSKFKATTKYGMAYNLHDNFLCGDYLIEPSTTGYAMYAESESGVSLSIDMLDTANHFQDVDFFEDKFDTITYDTGYNKINYELTGDVSEYINSEGVRVNMYSFKADFSDTGEPHYGYGIIIATENGIVLRVLRASSGKTEIINQDDFEMFLPLTEGWITED